MFCVLDKRRYLHEWFSTTAKEMKKIVTARMKMNIVLNVKRKQTECTKKRKKKAK